MSEGANGARIGIDEAAKITGISSQTLLRFAELGYLRAEQAEGLEIVLRREELQQFLSGREGEASAAEGEAQVEIAGPILESAQILESDAAIHPELAPETEGAAQVGSGQVLATEQRNARPPSANTEDAVEPAADAPQASERPESARNRETSSHNPSSRIDTSSSKAATPTTPHLNETAFIDLIRLQEEILALRDKELAELREQRDWLKRRIERLEDQASRDQVLLLSGSKTIQKLIETQQPSPRRSGLRGLLEFLGLAAKSEAGEVTPLTLQIETAKSKEESRGKARDEGERETADNRRAANE